MSFMKKQWTSPTFIGSFSDPESIPLSRNKHGTLIPEIAIVGRSNAGKSSLINALLNQKNVAKTGKLPGKTVMINLFQIHDWLSLADLPGYGYAKVSFQEKKLWEKELLKYLKTRKTLKTVLIIMDIRRSFQEEESHLFELIQANPMIENCIFVGTKVDKLTMNERKLRENELIHAIQNHLNEMHTTRIQASFYAVSSAQKIGLQELQKSIEISLE